MVSQATTDHSRTALVFNEKKAFSFLIELLVFSGTNDTF
jgi:hypothetical protein